jgi:hypothetical protein
MARGIFIFLSSELMTHRLIFLVLFKHQAEQSVGSPFPQVPSTKPRRLIAVQPQAFMLAQMVSVLVRELFMSPLPEL